jgi:hypothetical protein
LHSITSQPTIFRSRSCNRTRKRASQSQKTLLSLYIWDEHDCKRVLPLLLGLVIIVKVGWCHNCCFLLLRSRVEFCNVICTPFWELELCEMGPKPGVCNRELLCIYEVVTGKYLKIIYEEGSKISKYVASFCVYTSALYLLSTSL